MVCLSGLPIKISWPWLREKAPPSEKFPNACASALAAAYPGLKWVKESDAWFLRGKISFIAAYNSKASELQIYEEIGVTSNANVIRDQYLIELQMSPEFRAVPVVREIGGRVQQIVNKHKIADKRRLHVNQGEKDSLCLYPKPLELERYSNSVDLVEFLRQYVVPFLFGLSFFDQHGNWPWGEYAHGDLGLFEYYAERQEERDVAIAQHCYNALSKQGKQIVDEADYLRQRQCLCDSTMLFRKCHAKALKGLQDLKKILHD